MQRNAKKEGGLIAPLAWRLRECLISLIVIAVEAMRWVYGVLTSLPASKICCLTTVLVCCVLVCLSLEPYYNGPLILLMAHSLYGLMVPDESPCHARSGKRF